MTAQQYYEKGEALFAAEKYAEAKEQYLKATELAPDWAEPFYQLGRCHYWLDEYETAKGWHQKTILLKPDWEKPYHGMGQCLIIQKDYQTAKGWYQQAIDRNPDWERPYNGMGDCFGMSGDYETAKKWFQQAIDRNPDWESPYFGMGGCFKMLDDYETAKIWYQQAIDRKPDWESPYDGMGECFDMLDDYETAKGYYQQAIDRKPDWERPYDGIGRCYKMLGDYETAKGWYQQAIDRNPNWERPYDGMGECFVMLEDYETAKGWYQQAIDRKPGFSDPYWGMGECFKMLDHFETAKIWYQQAIDRKPDWERPYDCIGECFTMLGDYETAKGWHQQAIDRKPDWERPYFGMGECLRGLKDYETAKRWYQQAIDKKIDYADPYWGIGVCYFNKELYNKAITWFNKSITLNAKKEIFYLARGMAHYHLQQHSQALEDLKRSIHLKYINLQTIQYLLHYDTPFLINRLLANFPKFSQLMGLHADIAASQATAKPWLFILSFLDKPELTPAERLAWWRLKALVTYHMGDSPDAFTLYNGIIDELGMNLQDHYYYYLSAIDFGEKDPSILPYGLKAIDQVQNFTDNDHYYAGLLYNLDSDTANAQKRFLQIQNPVLRSLSLALLAEQAKDLATANSLYRQIDTLQSDELYQALFARKPYLHIAQEPTSSFAILQRLQIPLYYTELWQPIAAYRLHAFPHLTTIQPAFYQLIQIDELVQAALEMADRTNWLTTLFENMANAFEQSARSVTAQNLGEVFINTPLGSFKEGLSNKWEKWKEEASADWPDRFENSLAIEIQQEKIAVADLGIVLIHFLQQTAITGEQAMRLLLYAIKVNEFGLDEGHFTKEQMEGGKAAGSLVEGATQIPFQKVISVITKASFLNLFRSAEAKDKRNSQMAQLHDKKDDYFTFKEEYLGYLSFFQKRIQRMIAEVYSNNNNIETGIID
jgi:tetratricopeptide (TPR) repeat protein